MGRTVFATRSPRRPNPIGLTVVELVSREGAPCSASVGSTCSTERRSRISSRTLQTWRRNGCGAGGWLRPRRVPISVVDSGRGPLHTPRDDPGREDKSCHTCEPADPLTRCRLQVEGEQEGAGEDCPPSLLPPLARVCGYANTTTPAGPSGPQARRSPSDWPELLQRRSSLALPILSHLGVGAAQQRAHVGDAVSRTRALDAAVTRQFGDMVRLRIPRNARPAASS